MQFSISLETSPEYIKHVYLIIDELVPPIQDYLKDKKYADNIDAYWILLFLYNEEKTELFDTNPAHYRNYKPAIFKWKTRKIATMQETDYRKLDAAGNNNRLILGVIAEQVLKSINDTRKLKIKFDFDQFHLDLRMFFISKEWVTT